VDIAQEIRVWGARQSDSSYWGYNAYTEFIDQLKYSSVELDGQRATLVSSTETDEDYEGSIQAVFTVGDQIFAMDGTYSSWNGTSWEGAPYEVEAQPVTRFEYIRKR